MRGPFLGWTLKCFWVPQGVFALTELAPMPRVLMLAKELLNLRAQVVQAKWS